MNSRVQRFEFQCEFSIQRRTLLKACLGTSLTVWSPADTQAISSTQTKSQKIVSVFDYMTAEQTAAVQERTGVVDITEAVNVALAKVVPGGRLHFPAGLYICDMNPLLLRGTNNIAITGDGESTILRPSNQGSTTTKQAYHSIFAIDNCSDISIENMVIESKGENYGDTDAGNGQTTGMDRANWAIHKGGHALLICRSINVIIKNVIARRCGSVGVFYASSCQDVEFQNCFANARSLGYAGFAVDNWVSSAINKKRNYKFMNCRVAKEDATYSSKGCIVIEGDNRKIISAEIVGGELRDAAIGPDAPTYGTGITATDCTLLARGVTVKDCYIGIRLNKRGGVADFVQWDISQISLLDNKVSGIYVAVGSAAGGGKYSIDNAEIRTNASSPWAAKDKFAVKVTSGLVHDGYMAGIVNLTDVKISGGEYGVLGLDQSQFNIHGGSINALSGGITLFGAGRNRIEDVTIQTTKPGSIPIDCSTLNKAGTASRNSYLYILGNTLMSGENSADSYTIRLTGNSALFKEAQVKGNHVIGGRINVPKGASTLYDVS